MRGKEPKDEVQIYTWKDATLRELTDLVCILQTGCAYLYVLSCAIKIRWVLETTIKHLPLRIL